MPHPFQKTKRQRKACFLLDLSWDIYLSSFLVINTLGSWVFYSDQCFYHHPHCKSMSILQIVPTYIAGFLVFWYEVSRTYGVHQRTAYCMELFLEWIWIPNTLAEFLKLLFSFTVNYKNTWVVTGKGIGLLKERETDENVTVPNLDQSLIAR